jgi:hypothetical protein
MVTKSELNQAKRLNLVGLRRLAGWLRLRTDGMSDRQVAKLVWWLMTRRKKKERGMASRQ